MTQATNSERHPETETAERRARTKASKMEKTARAFARYVLRRKGYSRVFLLSKRGHKVAGIVDVVAIKKQLDADGRPDATEIILVQIKGNGTVTKGERQRLVRAIHKVHVRAGILEYKSRHIASFEMLREATRTLRLAAPVDAWVAARPSRTAVEQHLMNCAQ